MRMLQIDTPLSVNAIFWINIRIYGVQSTCFVLCTENRNGKYVRHFFLNLYSLTAKKETTKSNPVKAAIMLMLCRIRK